jgi:uncharacterized protein (TIGR01777 family)
MTESKEVRGRVAVSGASGFVGSALARLLAESGYVVHPLVRREAAPHEIAWDPDRDYLDAGRLEGVDAVVHLAGASIASLWTPAHRRRIYQSRARGTGLLARTIAALRTPPRILVSASGVGYYGDAGETVLEENSPPGDDFLAEVCKAWEAATQPAADAGVRVVRTRFGLVLHPSGGALRLMLLPFKLGIGARLGSGQQWLSWIALEDCVRVLRFALERDSMTGPVNAVSPSPVRNDEFTRILARVLHRPAFLTVPRFALRMATGGMAEALLLASQRAVPTVLSREGFAFKQSGLEAALIDTLK